MNEDDGKNRRTYSAEEVSQGEIILKRPWQRAIFIGGIAMAILIPLLLQLFA